MGEKCPWPAQTERVMGVSSYDCLSWPGVAIFSPYIPPQFMSNLFLPVSSNVTRLGGPNAGHVVDSDKLWLKWPQNNTTENNDAQ